jgi:iron(III) transport system substrate-binding protein
MSAPRSVFLSVAATWALLGAACGPATSPPAATSAPPPTAAATKPTTAPAPQATTVPAAQPTSEPAAAAAAPVSPALAQLIAAAKQEGKVNWVGPSNLGDPAAQQIVAAMNARYGTNIQVTYTSSGDFSATVPQILTEYATGGKPSWDAVSFNDTYLMQLAGDGDLIKQPYRELFGLPEAATRLESTAVLYSGQLVLPTYNPKLVTGADIPKSWDDMTNPRWQGRIGIHTAIHHLVRLSQAWGDDRTTEFARKLAALNPKLGRINETFQSMILGETLVSLTQTSSQMDDALKKGQPVAWAIDVRPAISPGYMCGALKNSEHPNAASLLCGFLFDQTARNIWGDAVGKEDPFDPSTPLGKIYVEGPDKVLILRDDFPLDELERLQKKYAQIIGFTQF